jgi:type IV pilus assembly protein PilY1
MIDAKTGEEDWAFVPNALIDLTKTGDHTYGMDSTPIFWIKDKDTDGISGSSDFVKMFIGMRRGGKNLYGFNVTNITTPAPERMWLIKGGEGDFTKLAQTWSAPKPVLVNPDYCSDTATECVVLIFGGGYDTNQDNGFGTSTIGNAIFMVKADTGELLWSASNDGATLNLTEMEYPIPSDLNLLDSTGDGLIDRIYVGDLGSQVWRIDIDLRKIDEDGNKTNELDQDGSVLAKFSDDDQDTTGDNRRFFSAPAHYYSSDVGDVVTIVSGRRTHPMSDNKVNDRFYTFIDNGWEWDDIENKTRRVYNNDVVLNDIDDLKDMTTAWKTDDSTDSDYYNLKDDNDHSGWYIDLSGTGEKGTSEPTLAYANTHPVVFFTTFLPPGQQTNNACEFQEGSSRLYALRLLTSGPGYDKKQDDDGNDIEEFAGLGAGSGDSTDDRSIILDTPGMTSLVQIVNTKNDGAFAITGFKTIDVDDPGKMEQTYWRQVDE